MTPARVLVVEDDRVVARDLQHQLTRIGHTVVGVTPSGEDAVRLAMESIPDLVLMDIRLEGALDGVNAAQQIRNSCQVPVVFLTAYADDETLQRARVTEPFGYLLKPFEDSQLRTVIELALHKHTAERKLRESERRYAVTLASIGDAVIATDDQGRVTFLNPAAETLTGWPHEQATGRPLAEVFHIINAETRQPVEDLSARVLRLGTVVGLADHTLLLARDGREVPIDDCGSPIIDDRGSIAGVVLVFRDTTLRQRAEEAAVLRKANARLELAFRGSNIIIVELIMPDGVLQNGRWEWVSAGDQVGGHDRSEIATDFAATMPRVHPNDQERVLAALQAHLSGQTREFQAEGRILQKDGSYGWRLARGVAVRDAEGRAIRFMMSAVDITELKRAEEALRESERRFRTLAEALPHMVWTAEPDGAHDYFNARNTEYTGLTPEQLRGWDWQPTIHPEDLPRCLELWTRSIATGELYEIEYRLRRFDGAYRWHLARALPLRDDLGRITKWFGSCIDIDDQKRAEEAEAERARLAELGRDVGVALTRGDALREILQPCAEALVRRLDAAFARIWTLGPQQDILVLQASAGLYTHTGGPHSRIAIGHHKIGQIARDRKPLLTNDVLQDPRIHDPEWARREGLIAFAGYPLVIGDRLMGVMGIFSRKPLPETVLRILESVADVIALGIERKRQQDELRRAKEAAEAASRAKDEFLANVSHEIRTPMNAILGMTELALDAPLTDDLRQCLTTVKSAADNLLGIINDLLDFSKIEAGKLELEPADFSLRAALGDTLRTLALRAHRKGLELIYDVQPDVPDALVGDAGRLRQVWLNLVGNAIKFTEEGEIVVRVELAGEPAPEEVGVRFAVSDTGIGIPPDKQEKIFRAFEQEDTSTTRRYGGTGLGLSIAAHLVALMGGTIAVRSEPGRGSTFDFMARFGRQPHPTETDPALPPVLLRDLRVLVVDDNATNRHILGEWLRDWEMVPTVVGDGVAAMDVLWDAASAGQPYPLVLLDARLAHTDGLALAARIRERAALSAIRIILLTSGDRPGDPARSRELRIDAYLLKPVQPDELLETIYRVMNRSRGDAPPAAEPAPARGPDPEASPAPTPLLILVAEDNEFSARFLERLLTRSGHRVQVATNGREALALAEEKGVDLMLLDVHMPELDGFQVVQALRERERTAEGHLPIIALTARSRSEDRERCLAAGMDDFLTKPVRPAELLAAIDRLVRAPGRSHGVPPPVLRDTGERRHLLDPVALLIACGGEAEWLRGMCQDFQTYVPARLSEMVEALQDRDAPRLRGAAHKLSALLSAFSTAAGDVASDLEDQAAQGRLEEARPLVEQLEAMARELLVLADGLSLETLRQQAEAAGDNNRSADL